MNNVGRRDGFTIIEVLIVLAVSGALFVSAVILIGGRQGEAAFQESARQVQSQVRQILNEVSTGYYPNNENFKCVRTANMPPQLSIGDVGQGSNTNCIFLGKVLQFKVAGTNPEIFSVYTATGLKKDASGAEVSKLTDALPVLIAPSGSGAPSGYPDNSVDESLANGLTVDSMWYVDDSGAKKDIGVVAFVNSLARDIGASTDFISGTGNVDVIAATGTELNKSKTEMVQILNSGGGGKLAAGAVNPTGGVFICFLSATTKDYAVLQIGGTGRDLDVSIAIKDITGASCKDL